MDGKPWFKPTLKVRCGETSLVAEIIFVLEHGGRHKSQNPHTFDCAQGRLSRKMHENGGAPEASLWNPIDLKLVVI